MTYEPSFVGRYLDSGPVLLCIDYSTSHDPNLSVRINYKDSNDTMISLQKVINVHGLPEISQHLVIDDKTILNFTFFNKDSDRYDIDDIEAIFDPLSFINSINVLGVLEVCTEKYYPNIEKKKYSSVNYSYFLLYEATTGFYFSAAYGTYLSLTNEEHIIREFGKQKESFKIQSLDNTAVGSRNYECLPVVLYITSEVKTFIPVACDNGAPFTGYTQYILSNCDICDILKDKKLFEQNKNHLLNEVMNDDIMYSSGIVKHSEESFEKRTFETSRSMLFKDYNSPNDPNEYTEYSIG